MKKKWYWFAAAVILIVVVASLFLVRSSFVNELVKQKAIQAFQETFPQYTMTIGGMRMLPWQNKIIAESVRVVANDSTFVGSAGEIMVGGIRWTSLLGDSSHDAFQTAFAEIEVTALEFPRSAYQLTFTSFRITVPDSAVAVEGLKVTKDGTNGRPGTSADSSTSLQMASIVLGGVNWIRLLAQPEIGAFRNSRADIKEGTVLFAGSQYKLDADLIHISVADSQMLFKNIRYRPTQNDNSFFKASRYRRTLFSLKAPESRIDGIDILSAAQQQAYTARVFEIRDAALRVLLNKEKPSEIGPAPMMPHEILQKIKSRVVLNEFRIVNSTLTYGERFKDGGKAAELVFDDMDVNITTITNEREAGDSIRLNARCDFMKAANLTLRLTMPVSTRDFSFRYSGSLARMDLSKLNPWMRISDHSLLENGTLHKAVFNVLVSRGRGSGMVQATYDDLRISLLDEVTGKESGLDEKIGTFIANNIKLRTENLPDGDGKVVVGRVFRVRQKDDAFFGFLWQTLRTGLADVIGF